jgi:1,2-dihydroxy-3-keto-5-methylthiopentene dioxygenase
MVEAWYYDESSSDSNPQTPHKFSPNQPGNPPSFSHPVSIEQLKSIGIFYKFIDTTNPTFMTSIESLCLERSYKNRDEICVSREKLPNYDEKIKMFFAERMYIDSYPQTSTMTRKSDSCLTERDISTADLSMTVGSASACQQGI